MKSERRNRVFVSAELDQDGLYRARLTTGGSVITRVPNPDPSLIKIKIDPMIFAHLQRKRRAGETVRMAVERAIMMLT